MNTKWYSHVFAWEHVATSTAQMLWSHTTLAETFHYPKRAAHTLAHLFVSYVCWAHMESNAHGSGEVYKNMYIYWYAWVILFVLCFVYVCCYRLHPSGSISTPCNKFNGFSSHMNTQENSQYNLGACVGACRVRAAKRVGFSYMEQTSAKTLR